MVAEADLTVTPEVIARHLRANPLLSDEAAVRISEIVEEMYHELAGSRRPLTVHLRSAKTFTLAVGALLAEILHEIHAELAGTMGD